MTRLKTPKVVVTFATTSDAMAMEAAARQQGSPGRIIPVPSEIDAGCGLAWCVEAADRDLLVNALASCMLAYENMTEIALY